MEHGPQLSRDGCAGVWRRWAEFITPRVTQLLLTLVEYPRPSCFCAGCSCQPIAPLRTSSKASQTSPAVGDARDGDVEVCAAALAIDGGVVQEITRRDVALCLRNVPRHLWNSSSRMIGWLL